jgi:hypothetical protein
MSQNRPQQDIQLVRISQEVAERLPRGRRVAHARQSLPGQMQLTVTPPLSREPAAAYSLVARSSRADAMPSGAQASRLGTWNQFDLLPCRGLPIGSPGIVCGEAMGHVGVVQFHQFTGSVLKFAHPDRSLSSPKSILASFKDAVSKPSLNHA